MTDDDKSLGDDATLGGENPEQDIDAQSLGDQPTHDGESGIDSVGNASSLGDELTFTGDESGEALNDGMQVTDLEERYTIEGELGKGGMGEVLLATDTRLNRKVAIKRILGKSVRSAKAYQRFLNGAQAIAALNHTNIVQVHDFGRASDGPFMILEYVSGGSLLDRCSQGPTPLEEAIDIACQLCDGLAKAHDAGITHRDIKPANVLMTEDGVPKLTDFDLAKERLGDTGMTMAGTVLGTLDFMPPEQRKDAALVDERSDLWSLAATLYQMVTGESPKVIRLKKVPNQLQDVLDKGLEEAKDDRYQTAREFRDALRSSLAAPDQPSVEAVAELGQGECPECHAKNKDTKKYCTGCGASLRIDCIGCNESIPVWDKACGECGARQQEEIQKLQKKRTRQRSKLEGLLQACEFDKAREHASAYRDVYDPRVDVDNQWADEFVARIDVKKELEQKRIVEIMTEAKSHQAEFDYDSGIRTLEQVPIALMGESVAGHSQTPINWPPSLMGESVAGHSQTPQDLVDELTITVTEIKRLDGLLKKRIPKAKKTRMDQLEIAEQLLELQPNRTSVQQIHDELVEQEREVKAETEELAAKAQTFYEQQDYDQCLQQLEKIQKDYLTKETETLQQSATKKKDEIKRLDGLLKKRIPAAKKTRMDQLEIAEQLLELQPDRNVQRIHDELVEQEREVKAETEELAAKAQTFYEQQDYDQCLQQLEKIQKDYLTKETETLQQSATKKKDEIKRLDGLLKKRIPAAKKTRMDQLEIAEQLLELQPDRNVQRIHDELVEQEREVKAETEELAAKAQTFYEQQDYDQCLQQLEKIQKDYLTKETETLQQSATKKKDLLQELENEIDHFIETGKWGEMKPPENALFGERYEWSILSTVESKRLQGLLPFVEEYLELRPGSEKMLQLRGELLEHQQYFEESKKHRAAFDYNAAIEAIQVTPGPMRSPEMVSYLRRLESEKQELSVLITTIKERVKCRDLDGLLTLVDRAVELRGKPGNLAVLREQLTDREADREAKRILGQSIQKRGTLIGHTNHVIGVAFSPDGQQILSGSWDKTIKLWDVKSGKELGTLEGHKHSVVSVAFSPDGKTVASGSEDQTIKLWNVQSGKKIKTLTGFTDIVRIVVFSPDGQRFASGSGYTIKLWDVERIIVKPLKTFKGHTSYVRSVAFSPDGQSIASGSSDATIKLWDVESGKELGTLTEHKAGVHSVAFSPDGQQILTGSWDKTIKLWDVESGKELGTLKGHTGTVVSVAFSPDGKTVASGSEDHTIKLWDAQSGKELQTLKGHTRGVSSVAFSPDGQSIASGSHDYTIKLWNVGDYLKAIDYIKKKQTEPSD